MIDVGRPRKFGPATLLLECFICMTRFIKRLAEMVNSHQPNRLIDPGER